MAESMNHSQQSAMPVKKRKSLSKRYQELRAKMPWPLLVAEAAIYALMLHLIIMYFAVSSDFIYEAF